MAQNGTDWRVYLSVTQGSTTTDTVIAGETKANIEFSVNSIDTSDKSSAWDSFMAGSKSWKASATFNLDNSATAKQKDLLTSLTAGTPVNIFVGKLSSSSRTEGHAGAAIIESISETYERNGVITREVSFKGTGAPTSVFPA